MKIERAAIPDILLLSPARFADGRGFFYEAWSERSLREAGLSPRFVQDNFSRSERRGTVRGLHFQVPPHAQDKLVCVLRGVILDVAVDLRRGSPDYGRHVAVERDGDRGEQMFVPAGFAHGFCTLTGDVEVLYKVTAHYAPQSDRGLRWNDPELGIGWPVGEEEAILSPRDCSHPLLQDLPDYFPGSFRPRP